MKFAPSHSVSPLRPTGRSALFALWWAFHFILVYLSLTQAVAESAQPDTRVARTSSEQDLRAKPVIVAFLDDNIIPKE
ncbi:hypothetical protein V8F33_008240 [Rhypophila sp. PSN 637]